MSLEQTTKGGSEQTPAEESVRELEDSELKEVAGGARPETSPELDLQRRHEEEGGK